MNDAGLNLFNTDSVAALPLAPRFCPRCGPVPESAGTLCGNCGETVREQGYCPICERFLAQSVGSLCPKHDVKLDDAPPPPVFATSAIKATDWVTVATFDSETEIEPPRVRLEAEGIPTFVEGSRMGSRSMYFVATGGLKLQVPQSLASEARAILSQTWAPLPMADDDLDDAWEELAPESGGTFLKAMLGVILLIVVMPAVLTLIALALWNA